MKTRLLSIFIFCGFLMAAGNAFGAAPIITYTPAVNAFTCNTAITSLTPTNTGGTVTATGYSISPALPTGLAISSSTGVISGTPTVLSPVTIYTVTAVGTSGGNGTFAITISVPDDWIGSTGGNAIKWATASNWKGGVPTSTTDVRIGAIALSSQPTLITAATVVNSITFGSTAASTLTVATGGALTLTNGITINGGATSNITGTGGTISTGSLAFASGSASSLTLTNIALPISGDLTINGSASATIIKSGTGTITAGTTTFTTGTSSLALTGIALPIASALTVNGGALATVSGTGTITANSATFASGAISSLSLTTGAGAFTVTNALTASTGASATLSIGAALTPTAGSLALNGGAALTLSGTGSLTAGSATLGAGTASTLTLSGGAFHITNALTVSAGVTSTFTGSAAVTAGSATFTSGTASTLTLTGVPFTVTNALTAPTGCIGTLSIGTGLTPSAGSLALNGGGALTLSGVGSLTAGSATLGAGTASTLTLSGGAFNITNALTVSAGVTSTFTGTGSVTAGSATFTSGTASTLTLTGVPFTVTNALTAPTGCAGTLSIGTGLTPTAGSLAINSGSALTLTGAGSLTAGSATFASGTASTLTISGGALTVTNALTISAGATSTITGTGPITAGSATFGTGTAASLTLTGVPLTVSNALSIVAGASATLAGTGSVSTHSLTFAGASAALTVTSPLIVTTTNDFTVNTGATASIAGTGNVNISPLATLNVVTTGVLTTTMTGKLTLKSDATGSASVGQILSTSITGASADSIHVERFITGGTGHRGYYLMSSPVHVVPLANSNVVYDLHYLEYGGMYLTGTTGFDKGGASSIYLYREDRTPSNASFTGGNFWGITKFNNANVYDYNLNGTSTIYNMPVGSGFMVFFRGARSATSVTVETYTTYLAAPTVTLTAAGILNAGQIVFHDWYKPSSANLGWSSGSTASGFNLAGNPYASSIDWDTYTNTNNGTGIYASANVSNTVYEYNILTHNYDTYQKGTGGNGAHTGNATHVIVSGQGFYVQASVDSTEQLIFNESAKITTQNIGANLFMSTRANMAQLAGPAVEPHLNLKLAKDSVNTCEIYVGLNSAASTKSVFNEDAPYRVGAGLVALTSLSSDNIPLTINKMPLPALKGDTVSISVAVNASGTYTLNASEVNSMPAIYQVWLMDAFTKDSLDMRQNPIYTFNVNLGDGTTFGSGRFKLVIRQNPALAMHLLSFTGTKAITGAQISWTTENEQDYTNFTVERSTDKGVTFSALAGFASSSQGTYSFLDTNPLLGTDMYRLKIVDLNGTVTYSNMVSLTYTQPAAVAYNPIKVYPNPVASTLNLMITTGSSTTPVKGTETVDIISSGGVAQVPQLDEYSITIVNNSGAVLKKAVSNQATWQTDVSNFMPGSYVIQVISKNGKGVTGQCVFIKL
ncbi:MAG: hypothetical protein JWR02_1916 [Mucilaginibacter sp.]|nr:hypothetical protein [Mucilaginibacter sp.]